MPKRLNRSRCRLGVLTGVGPINYVLDGEADSHGKGHFIGGIFRPIVPYLPQVNVPARSAHVADGCIRRRDG